MALSTQRFTLGSGVATVFGCGAIEELPDAVSGIGQDRAFLVTDTGLAAAGIVGEIERILATAGINTATFDQVRANPTTEDLEAGRRAAREFGRAVVVAIGGGSVLDVAKGIALMAVNDGPASAFDHRNEPAHPGLPLIAVPTTAGTGSETNGFGVIEDPDADRKFYVGHESVAPRVAILDPRLTCGLPALQTAATGMDVLAHALESLSSKRSNPYADGLALQVVRMVSRFLPAAVRDGQDLEARAQMLLASHMAGLAFSTTGLGMGHALAHALSARLGTAHGVALAATLPHVLSFNLIVRTETYAQVAQAFGVHDASSDDHANAQAAIDAVRRLSLDMGMPASLRELGCTEPGIATLVEDALADEVLVNAPRLPSAAELQTLLTAAL
jgi:alcohol dehydrogenase class IV